MESDQEICVNGIPRYSSWERNKANFCRGNWSDYAHGEWRKNFWSKQAIATFKQGFVNQTNVHLATVYKSLRKIMRILVVLQRIANTNSLVCNLCNFTIRNMNYNIKKCFTAFDS